MFTNQIKGTSVLRQQHRIKLFNYIRENSPVTRVEMYKQTDISKPTVTRVINEFIQEKLVKEIGVEQTGSGRNPVMLALNDTSYYAIGIYITRRSIEVGLLNVNNELVYQKVVKGNFGHEDVLLAMIVKMTEAVIDHSQLEDERILGIGIGSPGMIDSDQGLIRAYALDTHGQEIAIADYMKKRFPYPIFVDNNANIRALAEHWNGFGKGHNQVLSVICDQGIGAGIIENNHLIRGKNNITGEVGHMKVMMGGEACHCGGKGCVEAYSAIHAIEKQVTVMTGKVMNFEEICQSYKQGHEVIQTIVDRSAEAIATMIANVVGVTNPEIIILSGGYFDTCEPLYQKVVERSKALIYGIEYSNVQFFYRKNDAEIQTIGAALLVFEEIFDM